MLSHLCLFVWRTRIVIYYSLSLDFFSGTGWRDFIITAFANSIVLIFFLSYLVAILCVNWLRMDDSSSTKNDGWEQEYFGSLPLAIFTLINLILLTEYSEFMRPLCEQGQVPGQVALGESAVV